MKKTYIILALLIMISASVSILSAVSKVSCIVEYVVRNQNNTYTAYFGYNNPNATTISIPIGTDNRFYSPAQNMGQPTEFLPGRHYADFSVVWDGASNLVWYLKTPGSSSGTATASGANAIVDTDFDGVKDSSDAYPTDPLRTYNVYFPSATGWGTLAFEDLWPDKGDYDFNDLVVDYRFKLVTNSANNIKDITAEMRLRAIGATKQNALAFEFPIAFSNVQSYAGTKDGQPYNMVLTEAGARTILKVIGNTNDFVSVPGNDVFWNTQASQPNYPAIPFNFTITLTTPVSSASLPYSAPFNPFLIADRITGKEIHLPGMPPTALADASWFGLGDDTTNPATGRYYKTANNLPWAVNIPISWKYPLERKQITMGYMAFANWAESGGSSYPAWYELLPASQVDLNFIYNF